MDSFDQISRKGCTSLSAACMVLDEIMQNITRHILEQECKKKAPSKAISDIITLLMNISHQGEFLDDPNKARNDKLVEDEPSEPFSNLQDTF